jgi:hypothetical protein
MMYVQERLYYKWRLQQLVCVPAIEYIFTKDPYNFMRTADGSRCEIGGENL